MKRSLAEARVANAAAMTMSDLENMLDDPVEVRSEKSFFGQVIVQRAALGQSQGLVTSLPESSAGWLAILLLLCSQARKKSVRGTFVKK